MNQKIKQLLKATKQTNGVQAVDFSSRQRKGILIPYDFSGIKPNKAKPSLKPDNQ